MNNLIHKVKRYVTYGDGREPHWTEDTVQGWLASNWKDVNGREIYEGDIVRRTHLFEYEKNFSYDEKYVIEFEDATFWLYDDNDKPYSLTCFSDLEVIGHIVEDENENTGT